MNNCYNLELGITKLNTAKVAELVDAQDLGFCGVTRESSILSFRTIYLNQTIIIQYRIELKMKKDKFNNELTKNVDIEISKKILIKAKAAKILEILF